MNRSPALVLLGLSLVFFGIGHVLLPQDMRAAPHWLAAAPLAAFVLYLLGSFAAPLGPAARVIAALWPLLCITLLLSGPDEARRDYLLLLGPWPFVASAIAAGLALSHGGGQGHLPTLALFPFGAVLAGLLGTAALLIVPAQARLVLETPYHFVILLAFSCVAVALADAASSSLTQRRERLIRALIALMPLLGFLGTIAGLLGALSGLPALFAPEGERPEALTEVIAGLATAFETTLIGLVGSTLAGFALILIADYRARP